MSTQAQISTRKVAFVTGCTEGGIGYHLCLKLVEKGYTVHATARNLRSMDALDHPNAKKHVLDVTSDEQVNEIVERILEDEGRIDMLVNNAGLPLAGPLADVSTQDMKDLFDVNVIALHRTARAVIPHMAKRKEGLIMNIGSIVGEIPTPWMGAYESSKAAVKVMTEVLSLECKPLNIDVMLVAPAAVSTKLYKNYKDYDLPADSLYKKYIHNVRERVAYGGVQKRTMSAEKFADIVVNKAVKKRPPFYVFAGGNAFLFRLLKLLPRSWMLSVLWKVFTRPVPKK